MATKYCYPVSTRECDKSENKTKPEHVAAVCNSVAAVVEGVMVMEGGGGFNDSQPVGC